MTDLLTDALRVIANLNEAGVEYAVIGGVAMNLHGFIRATEDLDLFLRAEPANIERLKRALRATWDDSDIDEIKADDLCGDYPAVRYGPPSGNLYLDLLTRLGTFARFEDLDTETKTVHGVTVRVATPQSLFWLKRDTIRAIDKADAAILQRAFDLTTGER